MVAFTRFLSVTGARISEAAAVIVGGVESMRDRLVTVPAQAGGEQGPTECRPSDNDPSMEVERTNSGDLSLRKRLRQASGNGATAHNSVTAWGNRRIKAS